MTAEERALAEQLGAQLMSARKAMGLGQVEFAKLINVSASYVSLVERGHRLPHLLVVSRWVGACGASLGEVFANVTAGAPKDGL